MNVRVGASMASFFISADWSKSPDKRSVYIADLQKRRIRRGKPSGASWDLNALLETSRDLSQEGPVLIGIDAVLGVPVGYWRPCIIHEQDGRRKASSGAVRYGQSVSPPRPLGMTSWPGSSGSSSIIRAGRRVSTRHRSATGFQRRSCPAADRMPVSP